MCTVMFQHTDDAQSVPTLGLGPALFVEIPCGASKHYAEWLSVQFVTAGAWKHMDAQLELCCQFQTFHAKSAD